MDRKIVLLERIAPALAYRIRNAPHRRRGDSVLYVRPELRAVHHRARGGLNATVDLGVLSRRVVTNNGAAFVTDAFQNLAELEALNFHGSGTGTVAEAAADAALGAEVATRATGTQSEPASNQYRSAGTITYAASFAITEHGLFSASTAGTLFDRSVFAAINVVNGDSISFTYTLTISAGG